MCRVYTYWLTHTRTAYHRSYPWNLPWTSTWCIFCISELVGWSHSSCCRLIDIVRGLRRCRVSWWLTSWCWYLSLIMGTDGSWNPLCIQRCDIIFQEWADMDCVICELMFVLVRQYKMKIAVDWFERIVVGHLLSISSCWIRERLVMMPQNGLEVFRIENQSCTCFLPAHTSQNVFNYVFMRGVLISRII